MSKKLKLPRCTVCQDACVMDNGMGELIPCEMCQFIHGLPRPVVVRFADDMEQRLLENDHRGGWNNESKQKLANQLAKATTDLLTAIAANEGMQLITTKAADVANIAMFIANNEQLGAWPKDGVVIQDTETRLFLKHDPNAPDNDFPFIYVERVDKAERYESVVHAQWVAFWFGEINRRYRVIDYDNGGVQYVHADSGRWVVEGEASGVFDSTPIPAERNTQAEVDQE